MPTPNRDAGDMVNALFTLAWFVYILIPLAAVLAEIWRRWKERDSNG